MRVSRREWSVVWEVKGLEMRESAVHKAWGDSGRVR